jgi:hypothetical protein
MVVRRLVELQKVLNSRSVQFKQKVDKNLTKKKKKRKSIQFFKQTAFLKKSIFGNSVNKRFFHCHFMST